MKGWLLRLGLGLAWVGSLGALPLSTQRVGHVRALSASLETGGACGYWLDGEVGEGFDLPGLRQAELLSLRLHQAGAEDALLAAGAALALGKPALYAVRDRKELPWFLQQADLAYPGLVEILTPGGATGWSCLQRLNPGPLPQLGVVDQPVDSFIGCLMSKLTPEEYAEGRQHLLAIRQALQRHTGFAQAYCEGINVKSSSSFDTPCRALQLDLEALSKADHCIFYLYDKKSRPSGLWVELGAALAWNKTAVLLTPSLEALPPSLRSDPTLEGLKVVIYESHERLLSDLADNKRALLYLEP